MSLQKNEKILLGVLAVVALFAIILTVFVVPEAQKKSEAEILNDELTVKFEQKQSLLNDEELNVRYKEEEKKAQKNYDYFYSVLNGYSIDGIVSGTAKEKNLFVSSLNIGTYEDASTDFSEDTEKTLDVLVKNTVNLTVYGAYQDILDFMTEMNEKSTCLRMNLVSISENKEDATGKAQTAATFQIFIYGIDVEQKTSEEANENAA